MTRIETKTAREWLLFKMSDREAYDEDNRGCYISMKMNKLQTPKYHRQRLLLFLLEQAGGEISRIDFQKLLFLSHQEAKFGYYDFVPYHFGCYCFQAASDLDVLESQGWIQFTDNDIILMERLSLKTGARKNDYDAMSRWMRRYRDFRGNALLKYVYQQYPYYAIRSKIADRLVNVQTRANIQEEKKQVQKKTLQLFTLGYEGCSFEAYLNKLIKNDVRLLCDIRKNPLSRKFGFSRNILSTILPKLDINYRHIPELGIVFEKRKNLNSEADYYRLFDDYRKDLPKKKVHLQEVMSLLKQHRRIALTCFEKHSQLCHRSCVSDYLADKWDIGVAHL